MRIILGLLALVAAVVFLPGLLSGGSTGAGNAGKNAGSSVVDTVKDPQAVGDAVGSVTGPAAEVAEPYWLLLVSQPWFYLALGCGAAAFFGMRWWRGMSPGAKQIVVGVGVAAIFFAFMALVP